MAFRAFALAGASLELTFVWIGIVAIRALVKGERLSEIPSRVATHAADFDVRAEQRKFRLGMVELLRHRDVLPAAGAMAGFASALKFSPVGVGMAVKARVKFNSRKLYVAIWPCRDVAFFAGHFFV